MQQVVSAQRVWTNGVHLYAEVNVGTPVVARWITVRYRLGALDRHEGLRLAFAVERQTQGRQEPPEQETLPYEA